MLYLLPAGLNLDEHLTTRPPCIDNFCRENLAYVLHLVAYRPLSNRKVAVSLPERRGFVSLSAKILRQWLPDYPAYLHYALDTGLLETDNFHLESHESRKGKCRGYRFGPLYRMDANFFADFAGSNWALHEGPEPKGLTRPRQSQSHKKKLPPTYNHLLEWLNAKNTPLRINRVAAERYVDAQLERMRADPSLWHPKPATMRRRNSEASSLLKNPEEQALQQRMSIERIDTRALSPSVDRVGRLHSALTSLSSGLRQFVYAEGHSRLVSLDLSAAQPFLANLLLQPGFYAKPFTKGRRGSHVPLFLQREGLLENTNQKGGQTLNQARRLSRQCATVLQQSDNQCIVQFRESTSKGRFYEDLEQALRSELPALVGDRDALKGLVFEVMFSKNCNQTPQKTAFARLFPVVTQIFEAFKRRNHKVLPLVLQQLEAHVFLQKIVARVARKYPDVPVFTVHDSLVVPEKYADGVEQIMWEELRRWVGVEPTFKRAYWGSDPEWTA